MIKSMTGFGSGQARGKFGIFAAEIKTLNHKFLEMSTRLPNGLNALDEKVKNLVKKNIKRGKVYLSLTQETADNDITSSIAVDGKLAKRYCNKLKKLRKELGLKEPIKLADIVSFPGVINHRTETRDISKTWPVVKEAIERALKKLLKDREKEGSVLAEDIGKRIKKIKNIVADIKKSASSNVRNYRKKLKERIKELSGDYPVDRGRLEMEVALFAKNSDISEELTRLDNHIRNFTKTLRKTGEVGKKLDFIAQELHREINTVGSKSSGFNISKGVIEAKTEIEKIREQLKNIE